MKGFTPKKEGHYWYQPVEEDFAIFLDKGLEAVILKVTRCEDRAPWTSIDGYGVMVSDLKGEWDIWRLEGLRKTGEDLLKGLVADSGGCTLAGPGRGDCEHFVGLPGKSIPGEHDGEDDTVDVYGKPNGWCWSCWKSHQLNAAIADAARWKKEALNSFTVKGQCRWLSDPDNCQCPKCRAERAEELNQGLGRLLVVAKDNTKELQEQLGTSNELNIDLLRITEELRQRLKQGPGENTVEEGVEE